MHVLAAFISRELKQPRRQRKRKPHKFAYLTMKNSTFARFARAFFIFWHFEDVLVLSTTWNDLFCTCVDDVSIWWQMFNFVFFSPKRWFQFNSRIVRIHFSSIMSLNNWKMIAETRSHIFIWRSRFRRRRVCLSSLVKQPRRRRLNGRLAFAYSTTEAKNFASLAGAFFIVCTFRSCSCPIHDVKWPILQFCGHMTTLHHKFSIFFPLFIPLIAIWSQESLYAFATPPGLEKSTTDC